ncbi:MAG: EAL domain-containing protein [Psychrobium sp.]|nr:EAL domain-containing protein [Psychrobium sp.]
MLILFFIIGYGLFIHFISNEAKLDILAIVVANIFFAGSIFVCLVAHLSLKSILHLNKIVDEKAYQATHDSLTDLPNRHFFQECLRSENIVGLDSYTIMLMDLDKFKMINDLSGHHVGDKLLIDVANRLSTLAHHEVTISRLGGDEFSLLVTNKTDDEIVQLAQQIVELIKQPYIIDTKRFNIGISVGIAHYPRHATNGGGLLKCADIAMYHAKGQRLGYSLYSEQLALDLEQMHSRIFELEHAILSRELFLSYQPIFNSKTGKICSVEALSRWTLSDGTKVSPTEFIPLAQSNKLIQSLTSFVLQSSLTQLATWHQQGFMINMNVNLSATDFQDKYLVNRIFNLLKQHKIAPRYLTMEITENALLEDVEQAKVNIKELRNAGVHIAIDDFGTGFSSLNYLRILDINQVKLDHSFTKDLLTQDKDLAITNASIKLAHQIGCIVTAEGVDSEELRDKLVELGSEQLQGFWLSKPVTPTEVSVLLEAEATKQHSNITR